MKNIELVQNICSIKNLTLPLQFLHDCSMLLKMLLNKKKKNKIGVLIANQLRKKCIHFCIKMNECNTTGDILTQSESL